MNFEPAITLYLINILAHMQNECLSYVSDKYPPIKDELNEIFQTMKYYLQL